MTPFIMTDNAQSLDDLAVKRKRLIFRSWHRGTREMDLIMGSFADRYVPAMDAAALTAYERILDHPDPDLYNWISGRETPPANFMDDVLDKLLHHQYCDMNKSLS